MPQQQSIYIYSQILKIFSDVSSQICAINTDGFNHSSSRLQITHRPEANYSIMRILSSLGAFYERGGGRKGEGTIVIGCGGGQVFLGSVAARVERSGLGLE